MCKSAGCRSGGHEAGSSNADVLTTTVGVYYAIKGICSLAESAEAWWNARSIGETIEGEGESVPIELNPNEINFSQRTVSGNVIKYTQDMLSGNWEWNDSNAIRVMNREGQWVSYDNRRLMAAQNAGLESIPVNVVQPNEIMPGSALTWDDAFIDRFNHPWNINAGGSVPNTGISSQPDIYNGGK